MNNVLISRLKECGIKKNEILDYIASKDIEILQSVVYTSHVEGLGTANSDFDVYVIMKDSKQISNAKFENNVYSETVYINGTQLDIEYCKVDYVVELIQRVNKLDMSINVEEIKFLDKFSKGENLNSNDLGIDVQAQIDKDRILAGVKQYFIREATSNFRDALDLLEEKELVSTLYCARNALEFAIGIINTSNNYSNVKSKWISKIFLKTNKNDELTEKYLRLQIFPEFNKDDFEEYLEELLEFTQEVITIGCLGDS